MITTRKWNGQRGIFIVRNNYPVLACLHIAAPLSLRSKHPKMEEPWRILEDNAKAAVATIT